MNITKGEAFQDGWHIMVDRKSQHTGVGYSKIIATVENAGTGEAEDNAVLITDALNTYQACNLLPSELLQQRNELLNALKMALMLLPRGMIYDDCKEVLTLIQQ